MNEDGLVLCTAAEDAVIVWTNRNAVGASLAVLLLHLNWTRIDVSVKDFADVPQSDALVYSTGEHERTVGRKCEGKNGISVELKVNAAKWLLRRADPLDRESVGRRNGFHLVTTTTTTSKYNSLSLRRRFIVGSCINSSGHRSRAEWAES